MEYLPQLPDPESHKQASHAATLRRVGGFASAAVLVTALSVGGALAAERTLQPETTIAYSDPPAINSVEYAPQPALAADVAVQEQAQTLRPPAAYLGEQAVTFEVSAVVLPNGQNQ